MRKIYFLFLSLMMLSIKAWGFEDGQTVRISYNNLTVMTKNSSLHEGNDGEAVLWTETNTNSQRWILKDTGRSTFYLINAYSGLYLGGLTSNTAGSKVGQISKSVSTTRGAWELVPVEGSSGKYNIFMGRAQRYAMGASTNAVEGSGLTLLAVNDKNAPYIEFNVETVAPMSPTFTEEMRDDMMAKWKAHYYHKSILGGYVIGRGGWWGDAEMFEVVLDALETTGRQEYAEMFDQLYKNFCIRNRTDWSYNEYNDDISWMCIACVRAYLLTGNVEYRTRAKENFDKMYARANVYGNGTLVWKQGNSGTNSCINGPAAVCACYLGIALNNESYFEKAAYIYSGQRSTLFNINSAGTFNGQVYDSYDTNNNTVSNHWSSTYNQGTSLGSAILLYNHYGDAQYKNDADAIMKWTAQNLANSDDIIKVCQTVTGDLTGFKGILMRYVRMYAADLDHPEYYGWLAKNAYHAWNNRNSKGISMSAWLSKTTENFEFHDGGNFNTDGVGAFTAISAAYNAHLGVKNRHNPYEKIEAARFNYILGGDVTVSGEEGGVSVAGPMKNKNYLGYRRVDFGNGYASHINIRANLMRTTSKVHVYADEPNSKGQLLCTISGTDGEGNGVWQTIQKELNMPISGEHTIYLVAGGANSINLASVNWFYFESKSAIYNDLTNITGVLTANVDAAEGSHENLIDDDLFSNTRYEIPAGGKLELVYTSPSPILLQGYSLFSNLTRNMDPSGWTLAASNDGKTWTTIDTQSEVVFTAGGQRKLMDVSVTKEYTMFRLQLTAEATQQNIALSEFQLYGKSIYDMDITADGGTISEGHEPLIDHQGNTPVSLSSPAVYQPNGNYRLEAYSVEMPGENNPTSWTLEGSQNGITWTTIDTRTDVKSPYDNTTLVFAVAPTTSYVHYRLKTTEENVALSQWQLFGKLDFGTFYPDVTLMGEVTTATGSEVTTLTDKDGSTYATLTQEDQYWEMTFPIPVKPLGFSLVSGDNAELDPTMVNIVGVDEDGTETALSSRAVTFVNRGSRMTNSISTSKVFSRIQFSFEPQEGQTSIKLADIELYAAALADADSPYLRLPTKLTSTVEGTSVIESLDKLNDQVRTTRYKAPFEEGMVIQFSYDSPTPITTYAISSARDNTIYDPAEWVLEGSNNRVNWMRLDERSMEDFSHRYATQLYGVPANSKYTHYRFTFKKVKSGDYLQIGELQLLDLSTPVGVTSVVSEGGSLRISNGQVITTSAQEGVLNVYDLSGRLKASERVAKGTQATTLDLPHGLYILTFSSGDVRQTRKVRF